MDRYEFLIAVLSIVAGGSIVSMLIVTVGRIFTRGQRTVPAADSATLARLDDRLTRMEQAIDAVAVEVERISEGQRFTTRLLSDRAAERSPEQLRA